VCSVIVCVTSITPVFDCQQASASGPPGGTSTSSNNGSAAAASGPPGTCKQSAGCSSAWLRCGHGVCCACPQQYDIDKSVLFAPTLQLVSSSRTSQQPAERLSANCYTQICGHARHTVRCSNDWIHVLQGSRPLSRARASRSARLAAAAEQSIYPWQERHHTNAADPSEGSGARSISGSVYGQWPGVRAACAGALLACWLVQWTSAIVPAQSTAHQAVPDSKGARLLCGPVSSVVSISQFAHVHADQLICTFQRMM
jgi:hypothetical protein